MIQELSLGVYYAGRPPPISHAPSGASHTPQPFSLVLGEIKVSASNYTVNVQPNWQILLSLKYEL